MTSELINDTEYYSGLPAGAAYSEYKDLLKNTVELIYSNLHVARYDFIK